MPISAASPCTRDGSSPSRKLNVQLGRGARLGTGAGARAPAPDVLQAVLLRSTRDYGCGQRLVRALERPHRTPFKLRLRAQAGEGMRSEGQRRRVEIPTGFTSTASTVYRAARLPPSTAVYDPQPLDSVYHVYFVDDVYRLPPSTTVYHRLPGRR